MGSDERVDKRHDAELICFVNPDSINVTPYFHVYEDCFDGPFDLIYWDRLGADEEVCASGVYRFVRDVHKKSTAGWFWDLLTGYLGFRRFAKKILKRKNYRAVVLLTGNVGVLLWDILTKKYRGKYIIDIRDYFLESNPLYRFIEEKVIDSAALAIISSPAYVSFLGEHDFSVLHNVQKFNRAEWKALRCSKKTGTPFVLASVGTAKNLEYDRRVIDYFANDERFQLRFVGRGYDELKEYCDARDIKNVTVRGEFSSDETLGLYGDVDAILSMYGDEKIHVRYQLTNKLYYAVQLALPIVVSPGTYMAQTVERYKLGIALDLANQQNKDEIVDLLGRERMLERSIGAQEFTERIRADNSSTLDKITKILGGE